SFGERGRKSRRHRHVIARGDNGSAFFSRVHPAADCAMAVILVTEVRARRPSAAGVSFCGGLGWSGAAGDGGRAAPRGDRGRFSVVNNKKNKRSRCAVHPENETRKCGRVWIGSRLWSR